MIYLKIKDKKKIVHNVNIPTFDELTVKQFIDVTKILEENKNVFDLNFIINYVCYFSGFDRMFINESNLQTAKILNIVTGDFKDYTKYVYPGHIILNGKHYYSKGIEDFGQRILITQASEKMQGFEMYVFAVATAIKAKALNYDFESVMKFKKHLMSKNWFDIIAPGHFFFLQYLNGSSNAMTVLMKLTFLKTMSLIKLRQILKKLCLLALSMRLKLLRKN